jgi:hypothetical protein
VYVAADTANLTSATFSGNTAQGGNGGNGDYYYKAGGNGGNGFGGALCVAGGTATLRKDTVTSNSCSGGAGGNGYHSGNGSTDLGEGGGLYVGTLATVYLDAFTQANVTNNTASTSDPNIHGTWHGI